MGAQLTGGRVPHGFGPETFTLFSDHSNVDTERSNGPEGFRKELSSGANRDVVELLTLTLREVQREFEQADARPEAGPLGGALEAVLQNNGLSVQPELDRLRAERATLLAEQERLRAEVERAERG